MKEAAGKCLASYLFTNGFENCLYANGFVEQSLIPLLRKCRNASIKPSSDATDGVLQKIIVYL